MLPIFITKRDEKVKKNNFKKDFLRELFVKVFDYSLNPEPNFNLTTELKNEKGI